MSTPGNTVTIVIGARANTDQGFDRVRTAARNLGQSLRENFGSAGRSSGMSFNDRLRNVMSQGFATIGESAQGIGPGLGKALSGAASNPYVLAGVTGLVGAIAPLIGTLVGGALVLGIGGALAGVGIMAAAKAKEVQDAFAKTKDTIGKTLSEAAKPLEPVLVHVAESVAKFAEDAGPMLKEIFTDMAPVLQKFFDTMMGGFEKAAPALVPLTDAFNGLMDALGPVFADMIVELGESLGKLGEQFQKKETIEAFAGVVSVLISAIPTAVDVITKLAEVFSDLYPSLKEIGEQFMRLASVVGPLLMAVFAGYVKYLGFLYPLIAKVIGFIATFIETVVDGAPKVIDWIKDIVKWIGDIKGKTVALAQKGAKAVIDWVKGVINWVKKIKNRTVGLAQKGAQGVINWVKGIIDWVRKFVGKTVSLGVRGVSGAINTVQRLIDRIRNLTGKVVSVGVNFFKNAGSGLADMLGFASGGIIGSAATGGARSAMTLVGEQGPEIVRLPFGSSVHSNPDSMRMLGGGNGGSSQPIIVNLVLNGRILAQEIIDPLRGEVRRRGGLVQSVLGK